MSDAPEIAALLRRGCPKCEHDWSWHGRDRGFGVPACGVFTCVCTVTLASVLEAHTADRLRAALRAESLLSGLPTSSEGGADLSPGGTAVSQDIHSKLDGFASGLGDVSEVGEVVGGEVVVAHSPPEAEELAVEFLSVGGGCSVGCHASSVLDVNPLCQEVLTHRERAAAEKALRHIRSKADEYASWYSTNRPRITINELRTWLDEATRRTDKEADRG